MEAADLRIGLLDFSLSRTALQRDELTMRFQQRQRPSGNLVIGATARQVTATKA